MNKVTDPATFLGISLAIALVGFAIYLGGNIVAFFDIKSVLIVLGGTFMLTTACFTLPEIFHTFAVSWRTIFYSAEDSSRAAYHSLEVSEISRKKGILGLQNYEDLLNHNPFFKKGVNYIVDGIPPEEAENMLQQEMLAVQERHNKSVAVLYKAAELAPAMGLIGTLIGLVQMLGNLDDPSSIGPAMAVALLTTLYGAMISYMVLSPLATKLERNSHEELLIMEIYASAVGSVGRKENPRRLEMLLNALLPPSKRLKYFS
jgi:chemotaxis protein MotA